MFLLRVFIYLILLSMLSFSAKAATLFQKASEKAKAYVMESKTDKAIQIFEGLRDEKLTQREKDLKHFALSKWYQDKEQTQKSLEHLQNLNKSEYVPEYYRQYLLGHAYKVTNEYDKAMQSFSEALEHKPSRNIIYDSRFEYSEMVMQLNQPQKAYKHLKYLERRWRGTIRHPEVVWRLIQVETKKNRKWRACRWARKMYASYPGHPLVNHWGADLQKNTINGNELGCLASTKNLKRRIKKLQLYGQAKRARAELNLLSDRAPASVRHEVDIMMAEFLIFQGYPQEALSTLILHHEKLKNDFEYQMLLAKTSAKAAEYPTAIGAYYKAYSLKPKSKDGRKALFSAAFLSYQSQDYDGATRKFLEVIQKHPSSRDARNSRWHLAWIRYLKKDYIGAEVAFEKLLKHRHGRRGRYKPFDNDRTRYWLAMSYLRQGQKAKAKQMFLQIAEDKSFTFYSILSEQRLKAFKEDIPLPRRLASTEIALNEFNVEAESIDDSESDEAVESVESSDQEKFLVGVPDLETPEFEFKDAKLQKRFETAEMLTSLGFYDWARFELYEIERRTNNKKYLKKLMEAYINIGSYNRSLYISEVHFSSPRHKGGLSGSEQLWKWNFPYAYRDSIEKYTNRFDVSEALVLSIMRAESHFYKYAISPVGARGLMQLMPYTARHVASLVGDGEFADEELSQPDRNIRYGTRYLNRLGKQFENLPPLVAAAYNAGPHRVKSWLNRFGTLHLDEFVEHIPFVETRKYVKKVLRHYLVYNSLYKNNPEPELSWMLESIPVKVANRPSPRENWGNLD